MGFNTVHLNGRSFVVGYNQTTKEYFKYRTIDKEQGFRTNLSSLSLDKSKLVIAIDGNASVSVDDMVQIMGKNYIVTEVGNDPNNLVMRKRVDLDNCKSGLVITLE